MAIQNIDLGTVIENGEDGDVARTAFTKVNENFDDLDARVKAIEDLDIGTVTSVNDILPVDGNVDLTPADIGAATAAQGAKADTAVQTDVFATALNQKVDKVEGYQLSQEDYTTAEKDKLASLESSLFLGVYSSLAELEAAHPTSDRPGEYAFIPAGGNIYMFVWDDVTEMWVTIGSGSEAITAEQVKTLYESNPDTNAFTDAEKTKLGGIQAGAQVNVATNISQGTRTDTTVDINSSTGTGATLVGASTTEAGIMTAADKAKLNSMPTTTDGLTEGSTNLYFTSARVRQTLLTGLTAGTNAVIAATDSLISALAKLQAQISAKLTNPMTTAGDIIVGGSSGSPQRLAIGTPGQTVTVNSAGTGLEYTSVGGATRINYSGTSSPVSLGSVSPDATKVTIIFSEITYTASTNLMVEMDDGAGNWLGAGTSGTISRWNVSGIAGASWNASTNMLNSGTTAGSFTGKIVLEKNIQNEWVANMSFGGKTAVWNFVSNGILPGTQTVSRNLRIVSSGALSITATVKVEK